MVTCPRCHGSRKISWPGSTMDADCPRCDARGTIPPYDSDGGSGYPPGTTVTKKTTYTTRRRY